jgi:hypothetical protein
MRTPGRWRRSSSVSSCSRKPAMRDGGRHRRCTLVDDLPQTTIRRPSGLTSHVLRDLSSQPFNQGMERSGPVLVGVHVG